MTLALVRLSERRMAHTLAYPLTRHRLSRMCLPKRHLVRGDTHLVRRNDNHDGRW